MRSPQEIAFTEKVDANKGIVLKVVHLYADRQEDRKDLYQEVVYQAWKAFPGFKGKAKFSTWLYRVSLNTALTYRKQEDRRKGAREVREEDRIEDPRGPKEARDLLLWAIRKLEKIERMIILLHLEGYDNGEIAGITGLQKNNVGVRLHRIKGKLNSIIKKEGPWT